MKKILSFILILTMVLTMIIAYADEPANDITQVIELTDIDIHWAKDNINKLIEIGIVNGYPNGTFKPDNTLTFEEFIKMLVAATVQEEIEVVQGSNWYQNYIDIALKKNYIKDNMKELIGKNIDRNTMAEIIYNVLLNTEGVIKLEDKELRYVCNQFNDLVLKNNKVLNIAKVGIISGYPDKTFKPTGYLTRAEATTVILRVIDKTLRTPMKIDLSAVKLEDLMPEPKIQFVYNGGEDRLVQIYFTNWEYYSDEAEFKLEFPNNSELYKFEIISGVTGKYETAEPFNIWQSIYCAEGTSIFALCDTYRISNEYIENKVKLQKIKSGYDFKVILTVKDKIGEVEVQKKIKVTEKLNFKGTFEIKVVR